MAQYIDDDLVDLQKKLREWKIEGAKQVAKMLNGLLKSDISLDALKKTQFPKTVNTLAMMEVDKDKGGNPNDEQAEERKQMVEAAKALVKKYKAIFQKAEEKAKAQKPAGEGEKKAPANTKPAAAAAQAKPAAAADKPTKPIRKLSHDMRDKILRIVYENFRKYENESEGDDKLDEKIEQNALGIEELLWRNTRGGREYENAARILISALKNEGNGRHIRRELFKGRLTLEKLATLDEQYLRSDEDKARIQEATQNLLRENDPNFYKKVMLRDRANDVGRDCKSCGAKGSVHFSHQRQTRSADEPMTSFYRCLQCDRETRN